METAPLALDGLGAPPAVTAALTRLRQELLAGAGTNLAGLLLYGGLARGRFRPGKSDVNVVVLLKAVSGPALAAIAPALRAAWRAARVEPFILTPEEIRSAADAFPTKFLDIKEHHRLLAGDNPFAKLEITREHLRLRAEQELRNTALRLRRRYVGIFDDPTALATTLANAARPIAIEMIALLRLAGKPIPPDDRSAAIFGAAATAFGLDREALARLADLRRETSLEDDMPALYGRVLETLVKAAAVADGFKEVAP